MRSDQELIIDHNGEIRMREKPKEYHVANRKAVINSLLGEPTFTCPLTKTSSLVYIAPHVYVVSQISVMDLTTEWAIREDGDLTYETPVFQPTDTTTQTTRLYVPPLPTVFITRMDKDYMHSTSTVSNSGNSYLYSLSSIAGAGGNSAIRQFRVLPLANIRNSGSLCTGITVPSQNLFQIAEAHLAKWNQNNWNGDLWSEFAEKPTNCDKLVRYNSTTHDQMTREELGLTQDELLELIPAVAPDLPDEVLDAAWEVGHYVL